MIMTTPYFLITVVTKPEVAEHLIPNIKAFKIVYYIREDFKGGRPGDTTDKDISKVEILCDRGVYVKVMEYIKQYYVKDFGAVMYQQEAMVPL